MANTFTYNNGIAVSKCPTEQAFMSVLQVPQQRTMRLVAECDCKTCSILDYSNCIFDVKGFTHDSCPRNWWKITGFDESLQYATEVLFERWVGIQSLNFGICPKLEALDIASPMNHDFIDDALSRSIHVVILTTYSKNGEKLARSIVEKLDPDRISKLKIVGKKK